MWCDHKIRLFSFQGTDSDQSSHASYQTRKFHSFTRNRAQRGLVDAKISTAAPLEQQRKIRFKIGRWGLSGWVISALAVEGQTNPRKERVRLCQDILISRGCSSRSMEAVLIGNRLLRPWQRSEFGPFGTITGIFTILSGIHERSLCFCRRIRLLLPTRF